MSSQQRRCSGCHVLQNYEEFLNEKGVALKKCLCCQDKIKIARSKKKRQSNTIISYSDITKTIYNHLIPLSNTNEHYEGENVELNLNLDIELSSFLNHQIQSVSLIQDSINENKDNYIIESDNEEQHIYETDLAYLYEVLNKVHISFICKCINLY